MKKFQRILIAVDETPCSDKVISYAKEYFLSNESSIALITVVPPNSPITYGADPLLGQQPIIVPEITEIQQETSEKFVQNVAQQFSASASVFTFTRVGSIKQEILEVAQEWAADLIIMGTNGRTGFDHFISGSVSESVMRHANCPVFIVPVSCD